MRAMFLLAGFLLLSSSSSAAVSASSVPPCELESGLAGGPEVLPTCFLEDGDLQPDLSLIQVSAARMRAATSLEATPLSLSSVRSGPPSSRTMPTTDGVTKNKLHAKGPPVPFAGGNEPASGSASVAGRRHTKRSGPADATGDDSNHVIKRLKDRLKSEEHENAELKKGSDQSHQVAMARMEEEIADLKSANLRLHADLDLATTLLNQTQEAEQTSDEAEADSAEADPNAQAQATVLDDTGSSDGAPGGNISHAQAGAKFSSSDSKVSHSANMSFWKISVASGNEAPTVLLGGRNYSGDGAETDDEEPLVNISLAEGSGFSVAFTASWHQFHPFSRVLSLSDGTKDVLRVTSIDDAGTLSFSVRRCKTDGHTCHHDANVDVKKAIVVNATSRYLCSVSPDGKMQVYKDGRIVGRLKPDGSYVVPGQPGGLKVPAAEAKLYLARRTWMQRGKGVPAFEGFLGDICLWSQEVQPANSASCIES